MLEKFPLVAETKAKALVSNFITPNEDFFIRGHQAIPSKIDPAKFKFKLFDLRFGKEILNDDGDQVPVLKLTLEDLKKRFKPHKVMTAMSCAGNRRRGMKENGHPEIQGNNWYVGAIGNAEYTGVLITDLVKHLNLNEEELRGKHLIAESLDTNL